MSGSSLGHLLHRIPSPFLHFFAADATDATAYVEALSRLNLSC
jgi:hypothetical protein